VANSNTENIDMGGNTYRSISLVDEATGEIVGAGMRWGTGPVTIVDGTVTPNKYYSAGGVIHPYSTEQRTAKAARPEYACHWDNSTMVWVDDREPAPPPPLG